jgi:hypothetical protein
MSNSSDRKDKISNGAGLLQILSLWAVEIQRNFWYPLEQHGLAQVLKQSGNPADLLNKSEVCDENIVDFGGCSSGSAGRKCGAKCGDEPF